MPQLDDLESQKRKDVTFPSRNQVTKAGDYFRKNKNEENKEKYLSILFLYRRQHNDFLEEAKKLFTKKLKKVDKKAIIVGRLKRIPTIIEKLRYHKTMSLSSMCDIAGCRIITKNIENQKKIIDKLNQDSDFLKVKGVRDYNPCNARDDGYRGYHLIYSYVGENEEYKKLQIELQIRTEVQNVWATAVEIVDFSKKVPNLKRGENHTLWGSFFKQVSGLFEKLEKGEKIRDKDKQILKKNKALIEEFKSFQKEKLERNKNLIEVFFSRFHRKKYYILKQDSSKNSPIILTAGNEEEANDIYQKLEEKNLKDSKVNVVLIAARSFKEAEEAYLNYFSDTKSFILLIEKILKENS